MQGVVSIDRTDRDYEAFRQSMLERVRHLCPEYTDLRRQDPGVAILEAFSYLLDTLSYYIDIVDNEKDLSTLTQRGSLVATANSFGYKLRNTQPARAVVRFTIRGPLTTNLVIPRGFQVSTRQTGDADRVVFETDDFTIIPATTNTTILTDIRVTQGQTVFEEVVGSSNGESLQRFLLRVPNVIDNTIALFVDGGAGFSAWQEIESFMFNNSTANVYISGADEQDRRFIMFGDGVLGRIPPRGVNNIVATYRYLIDGEDGNVGAGTITEVLGNVAGIVSVTNPAAAHGWMDKESITEARINIPRFVRATERAVTVEDYKYLVENRLPSLSVGRAVAVAGQGTVVNVFIVPRNNLSMTEALRLEVLNFLNERRIVTASVFVHEAIYRTAVVSVTLTLLSGTRQSDVRNLAQAVIDDAFDVRTRDFGQGMSIIQLHKVLDVVSGVTNVDVSRLHLQPRVVAGQVGDVVWSTIVLGTQIAEGTWRVTTTSASAFNVHFTPTGGAQVLRGTGTLGVQFSIVNEVSFTVHANQTPTVGSFWTFEAGRFMSNINIRTEEIIRGATTEIVLVGGIV